MVPSTGPQKSPSVIWFHKTETAAVVAQKFSTEFQTEPHSRGLCTSGISSSWKQLVHVILVDELAGQKQWRPLCNTFEQHSSLAKS
jgi:hypothetical protein